MLIAHWPAGYLCARAYEPSALRKFSPALWRWILGAILIGSIFPDIDLFYFYLLDHRSHHHHAYPTHLPFVWLCLYALVLSVAAISKRRDIAVVSTAFLFGIGLHLILDTPMGGIAWLFPITPRLFHFITVEPTQSWWFWSFVFHWTFLSELVICLAAGVLFLKRRFERSRA